MFILCIWMSYLHVCLGLECLQRLEESVGFPLLELQTVINSHVGPLEEYPMLLTTESFLQPLISNFKDSVTLCHRTQVCIGVIPISLYIFKLVPVMTMDKVRPENTKTANTTLS